MENFLLNHTYLVKFGKIGINSLLNKNITLSSITILLITEKAYHIQWNKGLHSETSWELIDEMHGACNVIEDISEFVKTSDDTSNKNIKTINEKCGFCNGAGGIPDSITTAMYSICPVCQGNKNILFIT